MLKRYLGLGKAVSEVLTIKLSFLFTKLTMLKRYLGLGKAVSEVLGTSKANY